MKTETCKGSPDFELNIGYDRYIKYHIEFPISKPKGVIFFISCFGLELEYIKKWLKKAANNFEMIAISVEYHCYQSRIETGAEIAITQRFEREILGLAKIHNINLASINEENLIGLGNKLPGPTQLDGALFRPPNGDYQNFGLMQALDHLYVIADLVQKNIDVNFNNIILFGSSHGGYIAHMIAKLAPNTVRLIIDNSSYISPPPNFLGLNSEFIMGFGKNLTIGFSTHTMWQHVNPYINTYYDISKRLIRDTANINHLKNNTVNIIAYNASKDDFISFPDDKKYQQSIYEKAKIQYKLNLIDESNIKPPFKNLCHGMNTSLWGLLCLNKKELDSNLTKNKIDYKNKTKILFDCHGTIYIVRHNHKSFPVHIEIKKKRFV